MQQLAPEVPECAVCLQTCNHPARLPCGHIFCFLCAKGVAIQNKRCAMCRQDIPPDYLDNPVLVEQVDSNMTTDPQDTTVGYQWYYEGRNGWWKYDERSSVDLEERYTSGATECQLLVAGAVYLVDFRTMLQYRRNDATRRRRIKRDTPTVPAKGIAGIKILSPIDNERAKSPDTDQRDTDPPLEDHRQTLQSSSSTEDPETTTESDIEPDAPIIPPPHPFSITSALRSLSLNEPDEESRNSSTERSE